MDEDAPTHELAGYTADERSALSGEERLHALLAWHAARQETMPPEVEERARVLHLKRPC